MARPMHGPETAAAVCLGGSRSPETIRMIANPVRWPNGAKCACCLTFDMDADSLIQVAHPGDGNQRVSGISMLRYGPTVAVPRIVETYRQLGIRQTFFVPAW